VTYHAQPPQVTVQAGQILRLAEGDDRYGHGDLHLRITRVRLDISGWYDQQWIWLDGVEILPDGSPGSPRTVLARVAALPGGAP
jgi:hypothetical protein